MPIWWGWGRGKTDNVLRWSEWRCPVWYLSVQTPPSPKKPPISFFLTVSFTCNWGSSVYVLLVQHGSNIWFTPQHRPTTAFWSISFSVVKYIERDGLRVIKVKNLELAIKRRSYRRFFFAVVMSETFNEWLCLVLVFLLLFLNPYVRLMECETASESRILSKHSDWFSTLLQRMVLRALAKLPLKLLLKALKLMVQTAAQIAP